MDDAEILAQIGTVEHWYHRIEIRPGIVTPGTHASPQALQELNLPLDCSGRTALDLGTRDGFFAFELERRGAHVTAIDYMSSASTGFKVASDLLGSKVHFVQDNVYKVSPDTYGTFDIVLFLGLLYHLPDPLGALDIVRSVCRESLYIETQIIDHAVLLNDGSFRSLESLSPALKEIPLMQFYPDNSLHADYTNYWAPNASCLEAMLRETRFEVLERKIQGDRAVLQCKAVTDPTKSYLTAIARGSQYPV